MAYDPKDPADKAIVDGLIAEALEEAATEHEAAIEGLKAKNKELIGKLAKARAGSESGGGEEVARLEGELEQSQTALSTAQGELRQVKRDLVKVTGERDTATTNLETESTFARTMVVENGLTAALVENKVAPEFMDAAKALLSKGVAVKVDGDNRTAVVGDKPLGEHVKEWALSDQGKHFVTAPGNSGSNDGNSNPNGNPGNKRIDAMTQIERTAHYHKVGQVEFDKQVATEKANPPAK
jgi:hypothetical protein